MNNVPFTPVFILIMKGRLARFGLNIFFLSIYNPQDSWGVKHIHVEILSVQLCDFIVYFAPIAFVSPDSHIALLKNMNAKVPGSFRLEDLM